MKQANNITEIFTLVHSISFCFCSEITSTLSVTVLRNRVAGVKSNIDAAYSSPSPSPSKGQPAWSVSSRKKSQQHLLRLPKSLRPICSQPIKRCGCEISHCSMCKKKDFPSIFYVELFLKLNFHPSRSV